MINLNKSIKNIFFIFKKMQTYFKWMVGQSKGFSLTNIFLRILTIIIFIKKGYNIEIFF